MLYCPYSFFAIADYDRAICLRQDDTLVYHNHGTAKGQLGHYTAAIADYDMAIHLNLDFAEVYDGRGLAKTKLGQYRAVIADYNTAIRFAPNYANNTNSLGYQNSV